MSHFFIQRRRQRQFEVKRKSEIVSSKSFSFTKSDSLSNCFLEKQGVTQQQHGIWALRIEIPPRPLKGHPQKFLSAFIAIKEGLACNDS